mgnify:FL=1
MFKIFLPNIAIKCAYWDFNNNHPFEAISQGTCLYSKPREGCQTYDKYNVKGLEKSIIEKPYSMRAYIRIEWSRVHLLFGKIKVLWIDQLKDVGIDELSN